MNKNREEAESKRIPVHASNQTSQVEEDADFYYRWCADYDKGKLSQYLAAGYEFVVDAKNKKKERPGKYPLFLMRQPKKFREQDMLAKREKIIHINKTTQLDNAPKGGAVPDYIPKGQDSVLTRDDL